ncbi:hypothetical protein PIROE2DRAFT_3478 [Piromyces sp. E2]|nr:hypothetical protein PIROE2DRAFT_3478 [Piromyces sp. E2]|eukprot:OUM68783.1 hypothetical protein PIROE2DRAFT_3478 [Piromyces sp. E2]
MKFLTLFATLSTVAKVAFAAYCGRECDPNKVPETPLSGPLKLVAVVDNKDASIKYDVAGTVVIENDCVFTVKGFKLTPKSDSAKWYGASDPHSTEGILLSNQDVGVTSSPTDLTYNIKDTSLFCHASLLSDVGNGGVIRLMDSNYQLLAFAKIAPGSASASSSAPSASSKTKTAASTPGKEKPSTSTKTTKKAEKTEKPASTTTPEATKAGNDTEAATDAPAQSGASSSPTLVPLVAGNKTSVTNTNNNSNNSGALSSYKVPSLALYVALIIIAFVRF